MTKGRGPRSPPAGRPRSRDREGGRDKPVGAAPPAGRGKLRWRNEDQLEWKIEDRKTIGPKMSKPRIGKFIFLTGTL